MQVETFGQDHQNLASARENKRFGLGSLKSRPLPIENLWGDVKAKLSNKNFQNFDELCTAAQDEVSKACGEHELKKLSYKIKDLVQNIKYPKNFPSSFC